MARRWVAAAIALTLAGCGQREPGRVDPRDYDSFWLWAGVTPQPVLDQARTLYLLDGELRANAPYLPLRPGTPRLPGKALWLVVRTDSLDWPERALPDLTARLDRWAAAGNRVEGLQVDFDARTRQLGKYADFLRAVRAALPRRYRLSITGLLDGSANGDPNVVADLAGVVDELVVQTYQGRATIPTYADYFARARSWRVPFKVGLIQNGVWIEPASLAGARGFRGYVVFLINPKGRRQAADQPTARSAR